MARSYAPDATADDIVRSMRSFLSRSSDLEGVQLESEPVSFDFSNFRSVFEEVTLALGLCVMSVIHPFSVRR